MRAEKQNGNQAMHEEMEVLKSDLSTKEDQLRTKDEEISAVNAELARLKEELESLAKSSEESNRAAVAEQQSKFDEALKAEKDNAGKENQKLQALYFKELVLRKKVHNELEDLKGAIRVFCRVRPFAKYEVERNCQLAVEFPFDGCSIEVSNEGKANKSYIFDSVFSPDSTQEMVFEDTKRLCSSAVDGFNVCIFAYGQTGSGKTWTMMGDISTPEDYGIIPRCINEVFDLKEKSTSYTYTITCYMLEIYNEQLLDLLRDPKQDKAPGASKKKLGVKLDANKIVIVPGIIEVEVFKPQDVLDLLDKGQKLRKTASTQMNAGSSRSHMVFAMLINGVNEKNERTLGKLSLVDLAGSEKASKTGATGDQMKEAQAINKSLSALGDVISALSKEEKFIPYRNNMLTMMLQDSLGGNAKTLCFVNTSPADYNAEETNSSLTYAARMKLITNNAEKAKETEEVSRLKAEVSRLKKIVGSEGDGAE
jgi:hypothetical protein